MSKAINQSIKKETALLMVLVALFVGFVGGVVFSAIKFRDTVPTAHNQPKKSSENEAIEQAKAETLKNPKNFSAWVQLGNLYFDMGQHKNSIQAYVKALAINPNNANILTDLGVMYRRSGDPEKAVETFDKAIAADPKHEQARFNKGIVLLHDLDKKEEAINAWKELTDINPVAMAGNGLSVDELIRKFQSEQKKP